MANKIVSLVLAGIFIFGWFWTGYQNYYADAGNISDGYLFVTAITVALLRA